MQTFKQENAEPLVPGATLILPAVAFANIGELAIDVIISTLRCRLAARLDDENVLACVGNNAYEPQPQGQLATALELYQVPGSSLYLLQQRAPPIPGRQQAFAQSISAWAKQQDFAHVLVLCGLDAQYRRDHQLEGTQLRYLSSSRHASGEAEAAASSNPSVEQQQQRLATACEKEGLLQLEQEVIDTEREVHGLLPPWPMIEALQQQSLQHTLVCTFAAEGDNTQDGMTLAGKVLAVLQQLGALPAAADAHASGSCSSEQPHLKVPCSWAGLYGRELDQRSGLF